jgi:hypothetical protein
VVCSARADHCGEGIVSRAPSGLTLSPDRPLRRCFKPFHRRQQLQADWRSTANFIVYQQLEQASVVRLKRRWSGSINDGYKDTDDRQRKDDHQHVDRQPLGDTLRGLLGHSLLPPRAVFYARRAQVVVNEFTQLEIGVIPTPRAERRQAFRAPGLSLNCPAGQDEAARGRQHRASLLNATRSLQTIPDERGQGPMLLCCFVEGQHENIRSPEAK